MTSMILAALLQAAAPIAASTSPGIVPAGASRAADAAAVREVLGEYKSAIERLNPSGTEHLFYPDSAVFEGGGVEGNYRNYLAHHLKPELAEFRSFQFTGYCIAVRFEGLLALATETYGYRIETMKGEVAERQGVTTSVLKREGGQWRILVLHSSARKPTGA